DLGNIALWVKLSGNVWRAASVTWSPLQVFADNARLTASTASTGSIPTNSFKYVSGSGLYVNVGGDNPGKHFTEASHRQYSFYLAGVSWIVIDGFTATHDDQAAIFVTNANNVTITNNTATFSNFYGIQADNCRITLIG